MTTLSRADRESADIAWLSGPEALQALAVALEPDGVQLVSAQLHEVHHRPGAGVTAGYDVQLVAPGQQPRTEYLLATTADLGEAADGQGPVVELVLPERTLHLWRHPMDPMLPGLAVASDIAEARSRVEHAAAVRGGPNPAEGTDDSDEGAGSIFLELIGYRPLRRAVLSLSYPTERVFLKVVRPDQRDGLLARNRFAEPAGAPPILEVWPESVLVFAEATGEPLPELLARDGAGDVDPLEFIGCLDALADEGTELPARVSWAYRCGYYAGAAHNVLPDQVERIDELSNGIEELLADLPAGPVVTTHGDFHSANILMAGDRISSILDVDTLGPGQRVEDLACLIGHLAVLPSLAPGTYIEVPATLTRWLEVFDEQVDPSALRVHAAGVVLSLLASMSAGVQDQERSDAIARLEIAEQFLAEAHLLH